MMQPGLHLRAVRRWRRVAVLPIAAALLLAGCSGGESKSQKLVKQIASWSETAQMVGEQALKGAVPKAYARRTLQESQTKVEQLRKQLGKEEKQQSLRDALDAHSGEILAALQPLGAAIERGDSQGVREQIHRLSSAEDLLKRTGGAAQPSRQ